MNTIISQHTSSPYEKTLKLLFQYNNILKSDTWFYSPLNKKCYSTELYENENKNKIISFEYYFSFPFFRNVFNFNIDNNLYTWVFDTLINYLTNNIEISWTLDKGELLSYTFINDEYSYHIIFKADEYYKNSYIVHRTELPAIKLNNEKVFILRLAEELILKSSTLGFVYIQVRTAKGEKLKFEEEFFKENRRKLMREVLKLHKQPFHYEPLKLLKLLRLNLF